jgi:CheY-like chemotaxis protein
MKLEDATILVVDDEAELREIFAAWLGRKGCTVLTAANGAEALTLLDRAKVDVLVSDIRMPIMGGVALVRRVFELELDIPSIIFVSGYGDVETREMYGLGVEALMEKPLSRKDFIRTLEQCLMPPEELWLTPSAAAMAQTVALQIESLGDAARASQFQLGRGGCCFPSGPPPKDEQAPQRWLPLEAEKTIELSIQFVQEGLSLNAHGRVRWVDRETSQAGMTFDYLAPECRAWVIGAMRNGAYRSFIPPGRLRAHAALATSEATGDIELLPVGIT